MHRFNDFFLPAQQREIVVQTNDSIWPSAVGAFLGAFFAFLFGLITFYLQKKFERYWKHKNALVELENLLNDHLNIISGNQYLLKGAFETLKKHHMTYNLLTNLRLPEDIELRIGNLEALNKYADYKEPTVKVNHGMSTWQGMNEKLQQSVITNPGIPVIAVNKNMDHIQDQAAALIKFLEGLSQDTKSFLAFIRVFMRKDRNIWSIWLLRIQAKDKPVVSDDEIKEELKILEKETKVASKQSIERITKIMGN